MSKIEFIHGSSVVQNVDAIVNAANKWLLGGSGVCGAIFSKAGNRVLQQACDEYTTPLQDGQAVITPSFGITNAKCIIHAVGPDFRKTPNAFKELFEAYYNSLVVLKENNYHSISFPLISSGIFANDPRTSVEESTKQCIRAYKSFTKDYPDYDIEVKLCGYSDDEYKRMIVLFE